MARPAPVECEANTKLKDANKLKDRLSRYEQIAKQNHLAPCRRLWEVCEGINGQSRCAVAINEEDMASDDEEPYGVSAA